MSKKRAAPVRPRRPATGLLPVTSQSKNRILAALPPDEFRRLAPHLTAIPVRPKLVLYKQGERIQHVYFPHGGVISITAVLPDGTTVEAATVGDEGMIGVEAFLSDDAIAPGETLVQVPDTTIERLDCDAFRRELAEHGTLYRRMGQYTQIFIAQMVQTTACNVLHPVQQRCARWLLMTHDRMHEQDFKLSHEFMAVMLGVQRPTVSVVAGALQQAGLIHYTHGRVTVLDRNGLEAAACQCYPTIRAHYNRLLM